MLGFRVLGVLEPERGGSALRLTRPLERRLLAALLTARPDSVSVERLTEILWGDKPPAAPDRALQTSVYRLRRALGEQGEESAIRRTPSGYRLATSDDTVDADRFVAAVEAARDLDGPSERVRALDIALAMWADDTAYADFRYEDFAADEARSLGELRAEARAIRWEAMLALGRHDDLIADVEVALKEDPLRERYCAILMLALYRAGRQAEALRTFQTARRRHADVGSSPSPRLVSLEDRILLQDPSLELTGVGRRAPNNLPARRSTIVDREHDITALASMIDRHRLITVMGPGGVGKTTVAVEVARMSSDSFPGGAWLVPLASVDEPARLVETIESSIGGAAAGHGQDESWSDMVARLTDLIGDRRTLLLLDDCEHLADAVALIAEELSAACPSLTVLATSRQRLGVHGEAVFPVEPLIVGHGGDIAEVLMTYPAVRLLDDRMRSFGGVGLTDEASVKAALAIARRVDGIPLALELVASWTAETGLDTIERQLGTTDLAMRPGPAVEERHRSLDAVIAWSYGLLDDPLRLAVRRLATAQGGFTLREAAVLLGQDSAGAASTVAALRNRSLIYSDRSFRRSTMFRMYQAVRDFGLRQADGLGDLALRHAEAFAASAAEARLDAEGGPGQLEAIDRMAETLPDMRTAMATLGREGRDDEALTIAADLRTYWLTRRRMEEGHTFYADAIERHGRRPSPALARCHIAAGMLRVLTAPIPGVLDPVTEADDHLATATTIATTTDLPELAAEVQLWRGYVQWLRGRLVEALETLSSISQADPAVAALVDVGRASLLCEIGDLAAARLAAAEALRVAEGMEDAIGAPAALVVCGAIDRELGDHGSSLDAYSGAIRYAIRLDMSSLRRVAHAGAALASALLGDIDDAVAAADTAVRLEAGKPLDDAGRILQHLLLTGDLPLDPETVRQRLGEVFTAPEPDRGVGLLRFLLDLCHGHALRRGGRAVADASLAARSTLG